MEGLMIEELKPKKNLYVCYYCEIEHKKVECTGIFYCPNALCDGPGAAWFRRTLKSYKELDGGGHTVCEKELLRKGTKYNEKNLWKD